jgi:adenosylcobinamide kinase / adenosylcobinamide-phosphate guanylyltransferase
MAELVTGPDGAVVDGVLHLGSDGYVGVAGYRVLTTGTPAGLRYDVTTPSGERLSWTAPRPARRILVLGGARSGKSTEAERLLADRKDVLYVATGGGGDGDPAWAERIARHRARRPPSWDLAETVDLVPLLTADGPPLLIDCFTLWLARTMDAFGVWTDPARLPEVEQAMTDLAAAWSSAPREVVAVSNDVGSGVVPATASGVVFRDLMGRLNTTLARSADQVLWCLAGRVTSL